jgi:SAM-dependent methyltransferase
MRLTQPDWDSREFLRLYGFASVKRWLWNSEFSNGFWNYIEYTSNDCLYPILARYARKGDILDLGCGSGNTANELPVEGYQNYVGVDISDVAIRKAIARSQQNGRREKNCYYQGDILTYHPAQKSAVILFRESIYYVPTRKLRPVLYRYSSYLVKGGVFVVRFYNPASEKTRRIIDGIEAGFEIVEKKSFQNPTAMVIVFRPRDAMSLDDSG